jgi:hypothetical protein
MYVLACPYAPSTHACPITCMRPSFPSQVIPSSSPLPFPPLALILLPSIPPPPTYTRLVQYVCALGLPYAPVLDLCVPLLDLCMPLLDTYAPSLDMYVPSLDTYALPFDLYALYIAISTSYLVWTGSYLRPSSLVEIHLTFAYAMSIYSINRG